MARSLQTVGDLTQAITAQIPYLERNPAVVVGGMTAGEILDYYRELLAAYAASARPATAPLSHEEPQSEIALVREIVHDVDRYFGLVKSSAPWIVAGVALGAGLLIFALSRGRR